MGHTGPITGLFLLASGAEAPIVTVAADRSFGRGRWPRQPWRGTRFGGHESWVTALALNGQMQES